MFQLDSYHVKAIRILKSGISVKRLRGFLVLSFQLNNVQEILELGVAFTLSFMCFLSKTYYDSLLIFKFYFLPSSYVKSGLRGNCNIFYELRSFHTHATNWQRKKKHIARFNFHSQCDVTNRIRIILEQRRILYSSKFLYRILSICFTFNIIFSYIITYLQCLLLYLVSYIYIYAFVSDKIILIIVRLRFYVEMLSKLFQNWYSVHLTLNLDKLVNKAIKTSYSWNVTTY